MATGVVDVAALLARADAELAAGRGRVAIGLYDEAAERSRDAGDLAGWARAVLGLAAGQPFNAEPGLLPARVHEAYSCVQDGTDRVRLAAALARCWAYAGEPHRATGFAEEALAGAGRIGEPALVADALDAALAAHWGPDDLEARRHWSGGLADVVAHLRDPDARLRAHLWGLTVAWEVLDLPRIQREVRALERLGEESVRARFFAASRRLVLDLARGRTDTAAELIAGAEAAASRAFVPDAAGVLHSMRGYTALVGGDRAGCALEARAYEEHALREGVPAVTVEAAVLWLGAGDADRARSLVGMLAGETLDRLPRDVDWLLTVHCVLDVALVLGTLGLGDDELVERATGLLAPYESRAVVNAGAVMFHGTTDDTLGRAFGVLGDAERGERLRQRALATYQRLGASWWRQRLAAGMPGVEPKVLHLHPLPGGLWRVGPESRPVTLPPLRGLEYLRTLLRRPGVELPVLDLVASVAGAVVVEDDLGELLDERARRDFRERLAQLDAELDEASRWADAGRERSLREEREALLTALAAATGLGGRPRRGGGSRERARVAVRKALVAALARVAEADPETGRWLHDRVQTGVACAYRPLPDDEVRWVLD
ncbi:MAG TPA: hypothetical protein VI452_04995 [Marmoricola sp.]